ncbi:MAG: purine-nucleoside phosphorylase [Opitutales bacterium]|jgi:purine-nucleoside phosphorylase|nr:purine-nucleoside phosphorylase [Opitutales bacterium]MDP4643794.1 purine-nucleoside phosphorylase [Opitutales bacterium]MDP4777196.1 purine-nucleoside phosphorylase [Opitutales bacterium]MDP4884734.1 purine-nucleoside phosphorylase [Opitutales bacterium]MDP5079201.1 purine-nucleoside phosphorylase [Opitutales bacterium]
MKLPELPAELTDFKPEVGLILGSGLGFFADDRIEVVGRLPYGEIEDFPVSTVPGHAGQFVYGHLDGKRVLCMQGRFHFYEGYTMAQLTLPIRLMAQLGVHTIFVTNAAGGINRDYVPGDFMLLSDHINFLGTNPLIGNQSNDDTRFPDMSEVYDGALRAKIRERAKTEGVDLKEGVYLATTGPSFETPAEIRAFATFGADAVGMSTVPEAIVARQLGIRVIGISCITNAAAGISKEPLSHEEVSETADRVRPQFADLLAGAVALA